MNESKLEKAPKQKQKYQWHWKRIALLAAHAALLLVAVFVEPLYTSMPEGEQLGKAASSV